MSKTEAFVRITRLLISACVVPAGLGLSILQAQAGGMPGLSRNETACGDTTARSAGGSAGGSRGGLAGGSASRSVCDCLHCREANGSGSRLRRFFKCHGPKWSEPIPHDSWRCYHPCPPYFEPTFGIHQTSWTILPHDECQVQFATPRTYSSDHSPSDTELRPPLPPTSPEAPPEARNKAKRSRVTTAAEKSSTGDSRRQIEQQAVVPASNTSEKPEIPDVASPQKSVSRADSQRQNRQQGEVPAVPQARRIPILAPLADVPLPRGPAQADSDRSVPTKAFKFDRQTPDSLFTSHSDPIFRTKPAASPRTVSDLK